jgi:hypothetical protein
VPPPEPALGGRLVVATDMKHHAAASIRSPGGAASPAGIDGQLEVHGGGQEGGDAAARGRAPAGSGPGAFRHGSLDVEAEVVGVLRSPPCRRLGLVVVVLFLEELEMRVVARGGGGLVELLLREGYAAGGEVGEVRRHGRRRVVVVVVQRLVPEGLLAGGGRRGLGRRLRQRGRHGEGAVHDELLELGDAAVAGLHGDELTPTGGTRGMQ